MTEQRLIHLLSRSVFTTIPARLIPKSSHFLISAMGSSVIEKKFTLLRKRLDQLGFCQVLGDDSIDLVEAIFSGSVFNLYCEFHVV